MQSVTTYRPPQSVATVKSEIAREVFAKAPEVKQKLWGEAFRWKVYFVNTVGPHGNGKVFADYVHGQGGVSENRQLHKGQLDLDLS
jgi:REP element-mobilizing transposase RayT